MSKAPTRTKKPAALPWLEANQICLVAQFARLRARFGGPPPDPAAAQKTRATMQAPPAFEALAACFGLSPFEADILLLTAGMEMDSGLVEAVGRLNFGVAMARLENPHWSALTPARPLRHQRLIEFDQRGGLTAAALTIDERILHALAGIGEPDQRLLPYIRRLPPPDWIAAEHRLLAAEAVALMPSGSAAPLLHFAGDDEQGQEDVAAVAASGAGAALYAVAGDDLPPPGAQLEQFAALWAREALLLPAMLLIRAGGGLPHAARQLAESLPGQVMVAGADLPPVNRPVLRLDVNKPPPAGQKRLWLATLGGAADGLEPEIARISQQFRLNARAIQATGALFCNGKASRQGLWGLCRSVARPRLEHLAQRIVCRAGWDDLVLPAPQMRTLRHLAAQVRNRATVYDDWGFDAGGARGLGVSALFSGESGTGKTLAAEVLAGELGLDLYRIDLSAVVSKYIGETEKNLKQVFDAAEQGGALLLFDEADALFGKRGEVKDSHDRYANIEVGYLLQRMEAYQGLAILTTNLKNAIDRAFARRLRFAVHFPFPDAEQRLAIWRRAFPAGAPVNGIDPQRLAQLKVAGGNIRNIALNAAFLAADSKTKLGMAHVLEAATLESHKIERPLAESETRGWQ
jgi:hypothetical protein